MSEKTQAADKPGIVPLLEKYSLEIKQTQLYSIIKQGEGLDTIKAFLFELISLQEKGIKIDKNIILDALNKHHNQSLKMNDPIVINSIGEVEKIVNEMLSNLQKPIESKIRNVLDNVWSKISGISFSVNNIAQKNIIPKFSSKVKSE